MDYGSVSLMDIYESVLARITEFDHVKAAVARLHSRVGWAKEGQMSSRYFLRLDNKRGDDGEIVWDMDGICRSWRTFFSFPPAVDRKVQTSLVESLSSRLPHFSSFSRKGPVTPEEAHRQVAFWDVLGEDLVEVLNASLAIGCLPPSQF